MGGRSLDGFPEECRAFFHDADARGRGDVMANAWLAVDGLVAGIVVVGPTKDETTALLLAACPTSSEGA